MHRERLELYDDEMDAEDTSFSLALAWRGYDLYADRVQIDFDRSVKKEAAFDDGNRHPPHIMFPSIEHRAVFDRYGEVRPFDS
jgi:hypothetical protein